MASILVVATCGCGTIEAVEPVDTPTTSSSPPPASRGIVADPAEHTPAPPASQVETQTAPAASCADLLAAEPLLAGKLGVYTIVLPAGLTRVQCDMALDGGGWTLVGRSGAFAGAAPPPFGWTSATGSVDDDVAPYSLGALAVGLVFREVVVATRDRSRAYSFEVAPTFLVPSTTATKTGPLLRLAGDCAPTGGPTMLANTGATALTDVFFFRDGDALDLHFGLKADGFDLFYTDCTRGGSLDDQDGVVMVR